MTNKMLDTALGRTEAQIQARVIEAAEIGGWLVYHTYDSRRSNKGFPDLVLVRPPQVIFAELKGPDGRVTPEQQKWIEQLEGCTMVTAAVVGPEQSDALMKHLLSRRPSVIEQLRQVRRG